jgi:hypothetical protein
MRNNAKDDPLQFLFVKVLSSDRKYSIKENRVSARYKFHTALQLGIGPDLILSEVFPRRGSWVEKMMVMEGCLIDNC